MKIKLIVAAMLCSVAAFAQGQRPMSPPTIMIVPDDIFCKEHGYYQSYNIMGVNEIHPDYEKALTSDQTLHSVLTQVADLINSRSGAIEIVDILTAINNSKMDAAMSLSNSGDDTEAIDEAIIRNSQADFLVKVNYSVIKNGPYKQVSTTIIGTDAYSGMAVAPISGMGGQSSASPVPVLVREAIFSQMDGFLDKMLGYYQRMVTQGRGIQFNCKISNGSRYNMDSKVGQYKLSEVIDDFLYDNTVEGNGMEKVRSGRTFLYYQSIYIPLFQEVRGRARKQGATHLAQRLQAYLEGNYGITSEFKTIGLGKVNFYIK